MMPTLWLCRRWALVRRLLQLLLFLLLAAAIVAGAAFWWLSQPLRLSAPVVELEIEPGTTPRGVAQAAVQAGVDTDARLLYAWFRLSGKDRGIRAGNYEIPQGTTPQSLLNKLVRGEESLRAITFVEGWTFRQMRAAIANEPMIKDDTQGMSESDIMHALGKPGVAAEGRFFPDTYTYAKGSSSLAVLRRAAAAMDKRLAQAWQMRAPDTPLRSPEEALILASIVEKETGLPSDRAMVAGVFTNRLRRGMLLQTDPTVIYGVEQSGQSLEGGRLRKIHLRTDTPWNTYTRVGLPPTPIAMPGKASLLAAVQPATTQALYFVARGDGSSQFSATLDEHNRAVNRHIRGKP